MIAAAAPLGEWMEQQMVINQGHITLIDALGLQIDLMERRIEMLTAHSENLIERVAELEQP